MATLKSLAAAAAVKGGRKLTRKLEIQGEVAFAAHLEAAFLFVIVLLVALVSAATVSTPKFF
jgi:hypothetical protein